VNWHQFALASPELAAIGQKRLEGPGLALVATLRTNGWPRISPVEAFIVDAQLLLGMMWRSKKALDLLRDPRVAVHSVTCDREGAEGDFKVYGRVTDVADPAVRRRYADGTPTSWRRRLAGGPPTRTTCLRWISVMPRTSSLVASGLPYGGLPPGASVGGRSPRSSHPIPACL